MCLVCEIEELCGVTKMFPCQGPSLLGGGHPEEGEASEGETGADREGDGGRGE